MNRFGFGVFCFSLPARGFSHCRCSLFCLWLVGTGLPLGFRQSSGARINALMDRIATQCVRALDKNALDEFVIEQPLAINELVQHPRGNLLRLGLVARRRGRETVGFRAVETQVGLAKGGPVVTQPPLPAIQFSLAAARRSADAAQFVARSGRLFRGICPSASAVIPVR